MNFTQKIKEKNSGVLLYGITPPKDQVTPERVAEIAALTMARLHNLNIDALVVYDVQDESARTNEERPFPFINAHDPLHFAKNHLGPLTVPKIIYRPAGKYTDIELDSWLQDMLAEGFTPVFVGVPAPDFVPLTSLPQAYEIWRRYQQDSVIGAVSIPERHAVLQDEDKRILDKMNSGVSFFITQCIFNVNYAKAMIDALVATCTATKTAMPTVIFTLTACGSKKTLSFMEWLGIHIPEGLKEEFLAAENILERSVLVCLDIALELTQYCSDRQLPFGFNIESVAIRRDEIEASIAMVHEVGQILAKAGYRQ
jgi:hypothetical protein